MSLSSITGSITPGGSAELLLLVEGFVAVVPAAAGDLALPLAVLPELAELSLAALPDAMVA